MKRKQVNLLIVCAAIVALASCTTDVTSGSTDTSSVSTQSSSSEDSSSSVNAGKVINSITASDNQTSYYVGETFNDIYDLNISVGYSDGDVRDVSTKPTYYKLTMEDPSGKAFDTTTPFAEAGTYKLTVAYKTDANIKTSPINIVVNPSPTTTISEKSEINEYFNNADLEATEIYSNLSYPTKGTVKGLVVLIQVADYPFASTAYGGEAEIVEAADKVFNGDGVSDTGYWESVASYYKKTSYGQLDFEFTIAPIYNEPKTAEQIAGQSADIGDNAFNIVRNAVNAYKDAGNSTVQFDNDGDGYIDNVWAVYSCPNYSNSAAIGALANKSTFWAFCTDGFDEAANLASPNVHSFAWASYDFMCSGVTAINTTTGAVQVDGHTFIHETGHLLSLTDYYNYDATTSIGGSLGGVDMMDYNVGDHNMYSKLSLGWAKPYVVSEDSVVTIHSSESSGDVILLSDSYNGTSFDEFFTLELRTPTGLNALDSATPYKNKYPRVFQQPGIEMLHVDSRLLDVKYLTISDGVSSPGWYYVSPDDDEDNYFVKDDVVSSLTSLPNAVNDKEFFVVNAANSPSRCQYKKDYRLLQLITADGVNTETSNKIASSSSLFTAGSSWSAARKASNFFVNSDSSGKPILNNGEKFPWVISILSLDENSATIQFRKID